MAENPKKKTETAADAPLPSGASTPATEGRAPTAREAELQAQVDDLKTELADRDGQMMVMIDRLGDRIGAAIVKAQHEAKQPHAQKRLKREVPEEMKGPRTYIVGPKGAYQHNRRFVQGERITIVDQFPASDWTPVESATVPPAPAALAKPGRASDQNVG